MDKKDYLKKNNMPLKINNVPAILQIVIFSPRKSHDEKNRIIKKIAVEIGKAKVRSFLEMIISQIKAPKIAIRTPI